MGRVLVLLLLCFPLLAGAGQRIKEVAYFEGVRPNELVGYGLVVGLNGTGDKRGSWFTVQSLSNMLSRMGVAVDPRDLKVKNVAAVMVTAKLPPFAKPGTRIDVTVSSIGDATSLQGGTLLLTPLRGPDGNVYAVAQGQVLVGGMAAGGQAAQVIQNVPTVGRIPQGAVVEREVPLSVTDKDVLKLHLLKPDFTTAKRIQEAVNRHLKKKAALVLDGGTVLINVPPEWASDIPSLIAQIEGLQVEVDSVPKVVVDERTGTVVIGEGVKIRPVAVAHGGITVRIVERPRVVQPRPFTRGQTVVAPETEVEVKEREANITELKGATVGELVEALGTLGVSPRDLISILQAIKAAGALEGELEVI